MQRSSRSSATKPTLEEVLEVHVRWTDEAADDLRGVVEFLQDKSPKAALRIANEIYAGAQLLSTMSHRFRLGEEPGTREMVFSRSGYILTYEVIGDAVFIQEIRHGAQDRSRR